MSLLHMFGICFPHKWGRWAFYSSKDGWRLPRPGEIAVSACDHCNTKREKVWK